MEKEIAQNCFVPNCTNKKLINRPESQDNGQSLQFFRVPDGIEGLFWTKAVKRQRNYEKLIDLLSCNDSLLGHEKPSKKNSKSPPNNYKYCCEVHFDIYADIEKIVHENGFVEYKVKPGAVPLVKPRQSRRLCDIDEITEKLKEEEVEMVTTSCEFEESVPRGVAIAAHHVEANTNESSANDYVSIVDVSSLSYQFPTREAPCQLFYELTNLNEQQTEMNCEPIMPILPLTTAIMKRKSQYYMGLRQDRFLSLLQLANQKTQLSDVQVMVTLRKLYRNEEFEVLGDVFDLDKTTTEQHFHEAKHIVIDLVDIISTSGWERNSTSNLIKIISESTIKIEECVNLDVSDPILVAPITCPVIYDTTTDVNTADQTDVESSSPDDSSSSYVPSEQDSDFMSEDFASDEEADEYDYDISERTAECPVCNQFYTQHGLESHMDRVHLSQLNLNKTTCGLCLEDFKTEALLKAHQKDNHAGGCYACDLCGRITRSKRSIDVHVLTKHAQVKTFLCDTCGEGFPYEYLLTAHVKEKHVRVRSHKCHLCDMKYFTLTSLRDHICAVHTDQRPYTCAVKGCGKTFNRQSTYRSHGRVHAQDKYRCSVCSKQFSFKANLRTHLRNIHKQIIGNK